MTLLTFGVLIMIISGLIAIFYFLFFQPRQVAVAHAEGIMIGEKQPYFKRNGDTKTGFRQSFGYMDQVEFDFMHNELLHEMIDFILKTEQEGVDFTTFLFQKLNDYTIPLERRAMKACLALVAYQLANLSPEDIIEFKRKMMSAVADRIMSGKNKDESQDSDRPRKVETRVVRSREELLDVLKEMGVIDPDTNPPKDERSGQPDHVDNRPDGDTGSFGAINPDDHKED